MEHYWLCGLCAQSFTLAHTAEGLRLLPLPPGKSLDGRAPHATVNSSRGKVFTDPVQIPYEGTTLPGYFYKIDNSGKPRPTLIFFGGFDPSVEKLFCMGGAAGTGAPMREEKLPFRSDWEAVVTPAVDYLPASGPALRPGRHANLRLKGHCLDGSWQQSFTWDGLKE